MGEKIRFFYNGYDYGSYSNLRELLEIMSDFGGECRLITMTVTHGDEVGEPDGD